MEKKIFFKSLEKKNTVVSTGAGILYDEKIILKIKEKSISVFLDIKISNLVNRLKHINIRNRPKPKKVLKKLKTYKNRINNYNHADIKISVDELSASDIISRIIKKLNL